ncbi:MAG: ATP-binding protein [Candidatus Korarchaeum sp.]
MGYFTPEPKRRREDLYDMEAELSALDNGLKRGKIVVVSGLRRYGKTSLILTYLNEKRIDHVYLDCRLLPSGMIPLGSVIELLEEELSRKDWARRILRGIEGISIGELGVRFKERKEGSLLSLLHALDGKVIVLDEAQELRRSGYRFDSLIAYAYDHLDLRFVISGSMVGLLRRFLRVNDPEAPLYGRAFAEVRLRRLSYGESREFLKEGFRQEGIEVPEGVIDEAIRRFDGIIGWLTYFGFAKLTSGEDLDSISEKASKLALNELEHALKVYGVGRRRYEEVLRVIASLGEARWSEVRRGVEARLGRVPSNTLANILRNLADSGFIEKEGDSYRISDPVLERGIRSFW